MRREGLLEKHLPDYDISWSQLTNAASIREAMLSGNLDVGFMGVPPFLIGVDRGTEWRAFTALSEVPMGLVTLRDDVSGLEDLRATDARIALPQPGSIQHILLAMAAERTWRDATVFDSRLVTLSHPDAMTALLSGEEVDCHFATPPYLLSLTTKHGGRVVLSGEEAFGDSFTFAVGVAQNDYLQGHEEAMGAFAEALEEAVRLVASERGVKALAEEFDMPRDEVVRQLEQEELSFGGRPRGIRQFSRFMAENGYLVRDVAAEGELFVAVGPRGIVQASR